MQKTLKNKVKVKGKGLHTGIVSTVFFLPAPIDTGIKFQRIDLKNKPYINASINNVDTTTRRTLLKNRHASIETVEHLLAATFALSITNLIIEINGPEIPILDGSSKIFIELIEKAGIIEQNKKRKSIKLLNYFKVENPVDNSKIEFFPSNKLEIQVNIDYDSNVLKKQTAQLNQITSFKDEIAPSRTFCFLHEVSLLIKNNLIKGGDLKNAIIFVEKAYPLNKLDTCKQLISDKKYLQSNQSIIPKGILNNTELLFENEPARHKLLDLIGDISLAGFDIQGKIIAHKPGHKINVLFTQKLFAELIKNTNIMTKKPLLQINDIKKILPHREPFLFIDEIRELENNYVTGVKYVKKEEYYFKGHFPGAPVMPGVLQIEAMAQTGGILALNSVPDPENYLTYFMKIDKVKFKQKVEPNCVLIFRLNLLSPIRRGICHMQGKAYVGDELVTEAELMAKIVKEKK